VAELVRVDDASLTAVEAFLSEASGRRVRLGAVWLAAGEAGAAVAAAARASAVTLGPVVCLDRDLGRAVRSAGGRDALGRLGGLLVHECVHVWQYARDGSPSFLVGYLFSYFSSLSKLRAVDASSRLQAYLSIPAEVEARDYERRWLARDVP
jgi:hypothetical protein